MSRATDMVGSSRSRSRKAEETERVLIIPAADQIWILWSKTRWEYLAFIGMGLIAIWHKWFLLYFFLGGACCPVILEDIWIQGSWQAFLQNCSWEDTLTPSLIFFALYNKGYFCFSISLLALLGNDRKLESTVQYNIRPSATCAQKIFYPGEDREQIFWASWIT